MKSTQISDSSRLLRRGKGISKTTSRRKRGKQGMLTMIAMLIVMAPLFFLNRFRALSMPFIFSQFFPEMPRGRTGQRRPKGATCCW